MNTNKSPENYAAVMKLLHEFISEDQDQNNHVSVDEIRKDLAKEKINIDPLVLNLKSMISRKRAELRLESAKEKRLAQEKILKLKDLPDSTPNIKEKLLQIINELNKKQPKLAAMYFRKLEEVDEQDMLEILEDLLFLEDENNETTP